LPLQQSATFHTQQKQTIQRTVALFIFVERAPQKLLLRVVSSNLPFLVLISTFSLYLPSKDFETERKANGM
jgi:hypothetical protein